MRKEDSLAQRPAPNTNGYLPSLGFIGNDRISVPNYLFASPRKDRRDDPPEAYSHCRDVASRLLARPIEDQYRKSRALTDFLSKREMTFAKLTKSGEYRIFNVPCTNTPIPLPKSLFDRIERSAQTLVASLRLVLQDIYGAASVRDSAFVQSLPDEERVLFVRAIEECPAYFPQLHHPVMKEYPFFDVVGLDLVLAEDAPRHERVLKVEDKHMRLPFQLLELNAGSPSGASNNSHILEGLAAYDPEILESLGKVMPNDHFEVMGAAYRTIGQMWTGREDGVQIILPPGGASGAAPEIHQLAAHSGIIYADAGQLYQDPECNVRLRSADGRDPVVTAIYSRVNADSALYDPAIGIFLRDAESGERLYCGDPMVPVRPGTTPPPLLDRDGKPVPMESSYAIPNAVAAIHGRKLYLGGLNRVLDNKIILSILCERAPMFFADELASLGINSGLNPPVSPPETLPSRAESVEVIAQSPEDWVIKTPNLSGGKGVYILKTLPEAERKAVIAEARANPGHFAFQKLVRIGRIPVAIHSKSEGYHYANIAADMRMWVFFGAGESFRLPKLTSNALVRTAPVEKGPLSSIVNTSKGGGYAPMVVTDDIGHPESIPAVQAAHPQRQRLPLNALPAFAAAQLVQIAQLSNEITRMLATGEPGAYPLFLMATSLKAQCREVLSFLHPLNMEPVQEMLRLIAQRVPKRAAKEFTAKRTQLRSRLVSLLARLESRLPDAFWSEFDHVRAVYRHYGPEHYGPADRAADRETLSRIKSTLSEAGMDTKSRNQLLSMMGSLVEGEYPGCEPVSASLRMRISSLTERFRSLAREHLNADPATLLISGAFQSGEKQCPPEYRILFADEPRAANETISVPSTVSSCIATEQELIRGELITESEWVPTHLKKARSAWAESMKEFSSYATRVTAETADKALGELRERHFQEHPELESYRRILRSTDGHSTEDLLKILDILPYAKYNLYRFAAMEGLDVSQVLLRDLEHRRIAILDKGLRERYGLNKDSFAGECYARKLRSHGLFSEARVYLWVGAELNPLIQAYTIGHELIHLHQIAAMMEREREAIKAGPLEFARFMSFYGLYLGLGAGALEASAADMALERTPLYGATELIEEAPNTPLVRELRKSLRSHAPEAWDDFLDSKGSLFGHAVDVAPQVKVKAIREVIPALENAKNIRFAKDLGFEINIDEVNSALPVANADQARRLRPLIERAIRSPKLDWRALQVIANHQYRGVRIAPDEFNENGVKLRPSLETFGLGGSYNQTQQ